MYCLQYLKKNKFILFLIDGDYEVMVLHIKL